ncbi:hypothetical protein WJX77_000635 [Trebouxia sp. C0004]
MTHLEERAFLEDMHAAAKRYVSMLEGCITRTIHLDTQEEAASVTEKTGLQSLRVLAEQQQAWEHFLKNDKAQMGTKDVNVAVEGSTQDKLSRVAAMGGTPALGAGMVLPKLHQQQLLNLSNTESAAARELHAAQGRFDEHAVRSPQATITTPSNSPPWLVELRKRQASSRPSSPPT